MARRSVRMPILPLGKNDGELESSLEPVQKTAIRKMLSRRAIVRSLEPKRAISICIYELRSLSESGDDSEVH